MRCVLDDAVKTMKTSISQSKEWGESMRLYRGEWELFGKNRPYKALLAQRILIG